MNQILSMIFIFVHTASGKTYINNNKSVKINQIAPVG